MKERNIRNVLLFEASGMTLVMNFSLGCLINVALSVVEVIPRLVFAALIKVEAFIR